MSRQPSECFYIFLHSRNDTLNRFHEACIVTKPHTLKVCRHDHTFVHNFITHVYNGIHAQMYDCVDWLPNKVEQCISVQIFSCLFYLSNKCSNHLKCFGLFLLFAHNLWSVYVKPSPKLAVYLIIGIMSKYQQFKSS